jgi:hypothetical protein
VIPNRGVYSKQKRTARLCGAPFFFKIKGKEMNNDIVIDEVQRHKNMLLAMASMNLNREALLALCQFAEIPMTTDQIKYLRGPIITAKNPWATDMHTRLTWMFDGVAHARLSRIFSEQPGQQALASEVEVVIVMQPYTNESPLTTEWTNVFLWACAQASRLYQTNSSLSKDELARKLAEIAPASLSRYEEQQHYNQIAADIRSKVIKHAPALVKEKKGKAKAWEEKEQQGNDAEFDPSYIEQIFASMEKRVKEKEETAAFDAAYIEQIFANMSSRMGRE